MFGSPHPNSLEARRLELKSLIFDNEGMIPSLHVTCDNEVKSTSLLRTEEKKYSNKTFGCMLSV